MKGELIELRSAYKETQKKLSVQRSSTERIENLQVSITGIKEEKAKLLRRMREEKTQVGLILLNCCDNFTPLLLRGAYNWSIMDAEPREGGAGATQLSAPSEVTEP